MFKFESSSNNFNNSESNKQENEESFAKNFKIILGMAKRELKELTPRQEERARKIFNDCLLAGLMPTSPENSEQIFNKIVEDLKNPDEIDNPMTISDKSTPDSPPGMPTSNTGKLFEK